MPTPYTSIFDGPTIITRVDLCKLMNLDTTRKDLKFSNAEIKAAYRVRALRFHPDTQKQQQIPISAEDCGVLMNDLVMARDYLLNGTDNIPGKAYLRKASEFKPAEWTAADWIATVIGTLQALKTGATTLDFGVTWLYRFSSNILMTGLMSTFINGELNFRFVNFFSDQLAFARPYLKDIDGSTLANFLRQTKETLAQTGQLDVDKLFMQLKGILPESMTNNDQFDKLLPELKATGAELQKLLTDDFIDSLQYIIQFWPQFVANLPTWKQIMGVYFTSLIFTSNNLSQTFNALKVITQVIYEHKGGLVLTLMALPLLILTAVVLPISLLSQLSKQLAWFGGKEAIKFIGNGLGLIMSLFQLVGLLSSQSTKTLSSVSFALFESIFNMTIRLAINLIVGLTDIAIYILSSKSPLSPLLDTINEALNTLFNKMRPVLPETPAAPSSEDQHDKDKALVVVKTDDKTKTTSDAQKPNHEAGFFSQPKLPLHNQEDIWLNDLLTRLSAEHKAEEGQQAGMKTAA